MMFKSTTGGIDVAYRAAMKRGYACWITLPINTSSEHVITARNPDRRITFGSTMDGGGVPCVKDLSKRDPKLVYSIWNSIYFARVPNGLPRILRSWPPMCVLSSTRDAQSVSQRSRRVGSKNILLLTIASCCVRTALLQNTGWKDMSCQHTQQADAMSVSNITSKADSLSASDKITVMRGVHYVLVLSLPAPLITIWSNTRSGSAGTAISLIRRRMLAESTLRDTTAKKVKHDSRVLTVGKASKPGG